MPGGSVGRHQPDRVAGGPAARRADPHADRHGRRPRSLATRSSSSPSDTTAPPLSSWSTSARAQVSSASPTWSSTKSASTGSRSPSTSTTTTGPDAGVAARSGHRRRRAEQAERRRPAVDERQRRPSLQVPRTAATDDGGRRALWILNSSSLHLGWSSWPGRAGSARRRSAPRWPGRPPSSGLSTLIVEVEGETGLPGMFGHGELGYDEVVLSAGGGPDGAADVRARTLTADAALLEYLHDHGLSRISRRLVSSGALDVVATAAPGIKDILLLGKVKQLERAGAADLIVLDAPAAGHAITFLQSARSLLDAVSVGPINAQARDVLELLEDHRPLPGRAGHDPRGDAGQRGGRDRVLPGGPSGRRTRTGRGQRRLPRARRARRRPGGCGRGGRRVAAARGGGRAAPPRRRSGGRPGRSSRRSRSARLEAAAAAAPAAAAVPVHDRHRAGGARRRWPGPCSTRSSPCPGCRHDRGGTRSPAWCRERSIVVCCGSGGVGKTTTAAVLALEGARRGRRTVVVTIDPAKRLADALGLAGLTDTPSRIDGDWPGELWAMMLDTKSTFDDLVMKHAGTPEQGRRILANRFYRNISGALSGTQEYMAMEKLYELHDETDFDLVVVDTPPTRNALDFLDAPRRLSRFLDHRLFRLLMAPEPRVRQGGQRRRPDLPAHGVQGGRRRRGRRRHRLLPGVRGHGGGVPAAGRPGQRAAGGARDGVRAGGVAPAGHGRGGPLLRRAAGRGGHRGAGAGGQPGAPDLRAHGDRAGRRPPPRRGPRPWPGTALGGLYRNLADFQAVASREQAHLAGLADAVAPAPVVWVPFLRSDVHDLGGHGRGRRPRVPGGAPDYSSSGRPRRRRGPRPRPPASPSPGRCGRTRWCGAGG